ncbi:MAG: 4Fe-4S dicluster domain-containing protein [Kiritimatiellia bacterium]
MKVRFEVRIKPERCKGCGLCAHACPRQVLRMGEELNSKGYHYPVADQPERCTGCLCCAEMCPDVAIEIDRLLPSDSSVSAVCTRSVSG